MTRETRILALAALLSLMPMAVQADDWTHWRGPQRNGTSVETPLVSEWSQNGENLIWRADFTGRSTPVVFGDRVCANGRVGEGIERQEIVACFAVESGERLWESRWPVYHTTVPWNRAGWPSPTIDPATGNLFVLGVGGIFKAFDPAGEELWSYNLLEEFGFMEGYGGRTQTPIVDEERVILTFCNTSWGNQSRPLHRFYAFDKDTGEVLWVSVPGGGINDKNTQSTPAMAEIDGRRMLIHGNADGHIYAIEARTGEKIWGFALSKRGINTSVLVDGTTVYAAHSEENIDGGPMGRVVAIDATGSGDVTATHEKWRAQLAVGFASPTLHDGRLYVIDNSAGLHALDAATGEEVWDFDLGRVGKGSPVWGDGKIYATEVNGRFHIVAAGAEQATGLDLEEIERAPGRYAEIYGSPAIAGGRIYFTTEEGIYSLGDKSKPADPAPVADRAEVSVVAPEGAEPAKIVVSPAEARIGTDGMQNFRVEVFDAKGRPIGPRGAEWSLEGLKGEMHMGHFMPDPAAGSQSGTVIAKIGEMTDEARIRVVRKLPGAEDFEDLEVGSRPSYMNGYVTHFVVQELDGGKVLAKVPSKRMIHRHMTFLGASEMAGYTIQADVMGSQSGRVLADVGLINSGYNLDLMGGHQKLELRSWAPAKRMQQSVPFAWTPDVWYTMKLRVDQGEEAATIRAKVWKKGESEPEEWILTVEDPAPIRSGSPGLTGYSPTPVYYDNIEVMENL